MRRKYIFYIVSIVIFLAVSFYSCNDVGIIPSTHVPSWARYYGGTSSDIITATSLVGDGGAIVCGYTAASGNNDIIVLKLDQFGMVTWARQLVASGNDQAASVYPARDGGFIVAGQTQSFGATGFDICVIYLNADGSTNWCKFYRGSGDDYAVSVLQNSDADIVVAGYTNSGGAGANDVLLMKLDVYGNIRWVKTYGGQFNDVATVLRITPSASDGGYIIAGHTYSFSSVQGDILIIKVTEDGTVTWAKTYGGTDFDKANEIQVSKNGYILGGATKSFGLGPYEHVLVMNVDPMGNYLDSFSVRTFGQSNSDDEATSIQQTGDEKFYITGIMSNQIFLMRLFNSMVFEWEKLYGSYSSVYLRLRNDGTIVVAGNSAQLGSNDGRILSIQYDGTTCLTTTDIIPGAGNPTAYMPPIPAVPVVSPLALTPNDAPYTNQDFSYNISFQCPIH